MNTEAFAHGVRRWGANAAVALTVCGGVVVGDATRAVADPVAPPRVSTVSASVVEGAVLRRYVRFAVTLSWRSTSPVTVAYTTADGSAVAGPDYKVKTGTLTFNPGQFQKHVGVLVWPDQIEEPDEGFTFTLSNPTNASLGYNNAVGTIHDDEPHVGARIGIGDGGVAESCTRTVGAPAVITLEGPSAGASVLVATASGTATSGVDFTPVNKAITFASGVVLKEVRVPVSFDGAAEGPEQFTVTITYLAGAITVYRSTSTMTIEDCQPTS